jgi:putative heme iron utilization protein
MASDSIGENPAEPAPNGPVSGDRVSGGPAGGGEVAGGAAAAGKPTAWQARCLLRAARGGTLATSAKGQPFASLVTPACMPDGSLLLLLSRLAEHTRHLMQDPRCSVLVSGAAVSENPQTTPRVTVTGVAEVVDDKALKSRYLAVHPYATLYADFGDFATWRIAPAAGILVGGFARAFRLKAADFVPDAGATAAILAAEREIIAHCNQDHPDALAAIAQGLGAPALGAQGLGAQGLGAQGLGAVETSAEEAGARATDARGTDARGTDARGTDAGKAGNSRMVTADVDGFDLALGERVVRFAWSGPVRDAADVRRELVRLADEARSRRG